MNVLYKIAFGLILIGYTTVSLAQSTFYVSPSGSNGNDGSQADPFQTIQFAISQMTTGTTIEIMAGTYTEYLYIDGKQGTAAAPNVIKAFGSDIVVIDGGGTSSSLGDALLFMSNTAHLTLENLNFQNIINNYVSGVNINFNCQNITVEGCTIKDIHFSDNPAENVTSFKNVNPLVVYGASSTVANSNITLRNNEIFNCRTGYSEGITLTGNVDSFLVADNLVHDITNIGIVVAGHYNVCSNPALDQARHGILRNNEVYNCKSPIATAGGIYVDGGTFIIVENNICYDGQVGFSIGCENKNKETSNVHLRNNIAYGNSRAGVVVGGFSYPNTTGKVVNCLVTGNTLYDNDKANTWTGELNMTYCENVVVKNNIFSATNPYNVMSFYKKDNGTGNIIDYNLYYSNAGNETSIYGYNDADLKTLETYQSTSGFDANSAFGNPFFADPMDLDFRLTDSSRAANAGDPSYDALGEVDMDGNSRIVRTIVDCGAYESAYSLAIKAAALPTLAVYPNPTTGILHLPKGSFDYYTVTNMMGIVVETNPISALHLDLSNLEAGLFILTVYDKNKVFVTRVVKK
jgi:hypothetical protein